MGVKAKTDHTSCTFTVKEHDDGTPWIMIEFDQPGISALENGFLGMKFRPGITIRQAEQIAEKLCDQFAGISYTHFS
jgi:hypothetical protein